MHLLLLIYPLLNLLIVSFGFQPLAALVLGFSATWQGAPRTVFLAGLLMLSGAILLLVLHSSLRTWETTTFPEQVEQKEVKAE